MCQPSGKFIGFLKNHWNPLFDPNTNCCKGVQHSFCLLLGGVPALIFGGLFLCVESACKLLGRTLNCLTCCKPTADKVSSLAQSVLTEDESLETSAEAVTNPKSSTPSSVPEVPTSSSSGNVTAPNPLPFPVFPTATAAGSLVSPSSNQPPLPALPTSLHAPALPPSEEITDDTLTNSKITDLINTVIDRVLNDAMNETNKINETDRASVLLLCYLAKMTMLPERAALLKILQKNDNMNMTIGETYKEMQGWIKAHGEKVINLTLINPEGLTKIPPIVLQFVNLRILHIQANVKIQFQFQFNPTSSFKELNIIILKNAKVPSGLRHCPKLRVLNIRNTSLPSIPEEIQYIKTLQTLDIQDCQVQEIPNWVGKLQALTTLKLENNAITKISKEVADGVESLKCLESLSLKGNAIFSSSELCQALVSLPKLTFLDLTCMQSVHHTDRQALEAKKLQTLALPKPD